MRPNPHYRLPAVAALTLLLLVAATVAQVFFPTRRTVAVPSQSSSFDPASIPGLWFWVDANDLSTLFQDAGCSTPVTANGDPVGCWQDKSPVGNNDGLGTGGPIYETNSVNGLASLVFDGVNDYIATTFGLSTQSGDGFIVVKANNDPSVGTTTRNGLWFASSGPFNTAYPWTDGILYDSFGSDSSHTVGDLATPLNQWNVYNASSGPSSWNAYMNGTNVFSLGSNTRGWGAPHIRFGYTFTGIMFPGKIAEILIWTNHVLSVSDRALVTDYLRAKYALP